MTARGRPAHNSGLFCLARVVPGLTIVLTTLALGILGLSVPIAATQIFDRIIPNPQTPTLGVLVVAVIALALVEMLLRLGRAYLLANAGADFAARATHAVLDRAVRSDSDSTLLNSVKSLDYLSAVQHVRERQSGQLLVGVTELAFLPVILATIYYISPVMFGLVIACLLAFGLLVFRSARRLRALVAQGMQNAEERYDFLFNALSGMHAIKSLAVEDQILRRYELRQSRLSETHHEAARLTGRLLQSAGLGSQAVIVATLVFGALAVSQGQVTVGAVSALVLLSGRVMQPLQRAIFLIVQFEDVAAAMRKLGTLFDMPVGEAANDNLNAVIDGKVEVAALGCVRDGRTLLEDVSFSLLPGETMVISAGAEVESTALLHIIAGVHTPTSGRVLLNGAAPRACPEALRNRSVGYVPRSGILFRGTIRDNITRFGEVSLDDAMQVAALLEIDGLIHALPKGVETPVSGGPVETIPPGLIQQIAILRAISARPRLILFDNADRGLDRESYARLHKFIGAISGEASMIIVSDDANLAPQNARRYRLENGRLHALRNAVQAPIPYRSVKI